MLINNAKIQSLLSIFLWYNFIDVFFLLFSTMYASEISVPTLYFIVEKVSHIKVLKSQKPLTSDINKSVPSAPLSFKASRSYS